MKKDIFVSVILISYNSEDFIIEALESIKKQSFESIELIVSDDGSIDKTVERAERWLLENSGRFIKHTIIKSKVNTGITMNLNRGVLASSGDFIKLIAADDLLLENSVEDLLKFCLDKKLLFCFSRVMPFSRSNSKFIIDKIKDNETNSEYFFKKSHKDQYKALLRTTIPFTLVLGGFFSKKLMMKVGYFDEKYGMMEDYPFLIKISELGYKFELLEKFTYKYHVRPKANTKEFKSSKRYKMHYENLREFRTNEIIPRMICDKMYFSVIYLKSTMWFLELEYYNGESKWVLAFMNFLRKLKQSLINSSQYIKK